MTKEKPNMTPVSAVQAYDLMGKGAVDLLGRALGVDGRLDTAATLPKALLWLAATRKAALSTEVPGFRVVEREWEGDLYFGLQTEGSPPSDEFEGICFNIKGAVWDAMTVEPPGSPHQRLSPEFYAALGQATPMPTTLDFDPRNPQLKPEEALMRVLESMLDSEAARPTVEGLRSFAAYRLHMGAASTRGEEALNEYIAQGNFLARRTSIEVREGETLAEADARGHEELSKKGWTGNVPELLLPSPAYDALVAEVLA